MPLSHYPKRCLLLLLALLQLVAPLVHAHADFDDSPQGFHLPGFEFTGVQQTEPQLQNRTLQSEPHGFVAGVVMGIPHEQPETASQKPIQYPLFAASCLREAYRRPRAHAPPIVAPPRDSTSPPPPLRAPPHQPPALS